MRYLLTSLLCVLTLSLTAQEPLTYPYNPDATGDENIGSTDLIELLTLYGGQFLPEEIMVGDTMLSSWILILNQTLINQQLVIDSLIQANIENIEEWDNPNEGVISELSDNHGILYIDIDTTIFFTVPPLISVLEVKIVGGQGGAGGSVPGPSQDENGVWSYGCPYNPGSGGGGGQGGMIRALIMCSPGDVIEISIGENGQNGSDGVSWCANGGNGTSGTSSYLKIGGVEILTALFGGPGTGAECGCGANGVQNGQSGGAGGTSLNDEFFLQSGVLILDMINGAGGESYIRY
jgi:hypothetical protein